MVNEIIEGRILKLESLTSKLGQSMQLTNEVMSEFVSIISSTVSQEIKHQVKEEFLTATNEMESKLIGTVEGFVEDKVKVAVSKRGLNIDEINELTKERNYRFIQLLGNPNSNKYILYIEFYQKALSTSYKENFNCTSYNRIQATSFNDAIRFIQTFDVSEKYYIWMTNALHENFRNKTRIFDENRCKTKEINEAYEQYFRINSEI